MNERIQELAEQATEIVEMVGSQGYASSYVKFDKEKFAELIIQECMDVAKDHTPETEECEYTWLIHDKIKEHFGVEE